MGKKEGTAARCTRHNQGKGHVCMAGKTQTRTHEFDLVSVLQRQNQCNFGLRLAGTQAVLLLGAQRPWYNGSRSWRKIKKANLRAGGETKKVVMNRGRGRNCGSCRKAG